MGPRALLLIVFAAVLCVVQGLKCNHCVSVDKDHPNCTKIDEQECLEGFNNCITITMHGSAYGEVRRCASDKECQTATPEQVQHKCCKSDNCNTRGNLN